VANQITDGRTNVDTMESTSAPDDLTGGASGTNDTEVYYQGSSSWGYYGGTTRDGLLHDAGSAQDWSSNTFHLLVNCAIVAFLKTKSNGGLTVRFCGATVTDWFEVYVAGSDAWPTAFEGGWVQFVVDIETARSEAVTAGWTNGTTPATSAIRYVGISSQTATIMPRMVDNTWLDQITRLPDGTAGIKIEGKNGGTTDWKWDDVVSAADTGKWGTCRRGPGGSVVLNAPVQFGINDTSTHEFTDTNQVLLWDDQEFLPDDFYALSALGNSGGTTNITAGVKAGTGNDATGAQGWVVTAASGGARWSLDFDDANIDSIGIYGCSLIHSATLDLDDAANDLASVLLIDGNKAHVSNASVVRASVIAPNTADGVAYMDTDDLGDIAYSNFEFTDGHGIEILTGGPSSQNNVGNLFTGSYGGTPGDNNTPASGSNDAMIYNNAAAARTFNRSGGGTQPSFRNGTSATSDDVATINLTFTPLVAGSEVRVFDTGTSDYADAGTDSSGTSYVASVSAGAAIDYKIIYPGKLEIFVINKTFSVSQNIDVNQQTDRNYDPVD